MEITLGTQYNAGEKDTTLGQQYSVGEKRTQEKQEQRQYSTPSSIIIRVAGQYHFTPHHAHRELYTIFYIVQYVFHLCVLDFSQQDEYSRTSPI